MVVEIYNNPINKEIEVAITSKDIETLWEVFSSLEGNKEFEVEYEKVKYGIKTKFDIRSIIEGQYQMEVAFQRVRIERKTIINLTKFRDEIDERKKIMKDIIRSLYEEGFDRQGEVEISGYEED